MTRKDFNLIASVFKDMAKWYDEYGNVTNDHAIETRANIANALADGLATTNPNFDRERFLVACGVEA